MQRHGKAMEPIAISEYSEHTWQNVKEVGFIELSKYAGTSPDGIIVGENKGVEIKCLMHKEHMKIVDHNSPLVSHLYQCEWHMFITGFDTWDLVYYHPDMKQKSLLIYELKKNEIIHERFNKAYQTASKEIERLVSLCL